jgi:lipopolysaccharide transport system ATP-binding protein
MSENAIVVENLSKRYLIGHRIHTGQKYQYTALRDVISRKIANVARKTTAVVGGHKMVQADEVEEFWALSDVNFKVERGEALGIIGRNGAGKSTLLKILTRITEPTKGRLVLGGRVASMLEVGTGFHPELTGRENIFLNGAILGMTQREIRSKFDEIVTFAEVERFLDTPVKHFSSGMYVRLAFAVAAHLEPDILVVDEVLAVGDADFQRKCLGKMDDVSRKEGRTILFVSHNMETVVRLCARAVFLEFGRVRAIGDAETVVSTYLASQSVSPASIELLSKKRPSYFAGKARIAKVSPSEAQGSWSLPFGQDLSLDLSINAEPSESRVDVLIVLFSTQGFRLASWTNKCSDVELRLRPGINTFRIELRDFRLLPGRYSLGIGVRDTKGCDDWIREAVQFEIIPNLQAAKINLENPVGAFVLSATVSPIDEGDATDIADIGTAYRP